MRHATPSTAARLLLAGLVLLPAVATTAPARAEWVYRTVRVCTPENRYVQRCRPERKCETSYRFENRWCSSCNPPRMENQRVPYQICSTQERCSREATTVQNCRNEERRVWVTNPKVIPDKVPPPPPPEEDKD